MITFRLWMPLLLCFFAAIPICAVPPVLRWGADAEGGAPYVFQDPADPSRIIGFEVDLMEALARELGVKTEFVQQQWDGLIPALERGSFHVAVNGLEITPDREEVVAFSRPYFHTHQQLVVRRETHSIASLTDCVGKKVGTLKGSLAERILSEVRGIQISSNDGQINAYEDLALGRTDAVLMDHPIAIYYGQPNPKLKLVGPPIGKMTYGIAVRKADAELLGKINDALQRLIHSGKLREIYERWNLWNSAMAEAFQDPSPSTVAPAAYEAFVATITRERSWQERLWQYLSYMPLLARGAVMTLALSLLAMAVAVSTGLGLALARVYGATPARWLAIAFIETVRGTPLLIQLYLIFYGLPHLGIKLDPFTAAFLGLGLNYAAYEAENYRAGLNAVAAGQSEAALALGMTQRQALRYVIIPQAARIVIPPMTNDFISLLKDSSLVSVITMVELTKVYGQLAATYYDYLGIGILTAAVYLLLGLPFVRIARRAEQKFSVGQATLPRLHPV